VSSHTASFSHSLRPSLEARARLARGTDARRGVLAAIRFPGRRTRPLSAFGTVMQAGVGLACGSVLLTARLCG